MRKFTKVIAALTLTATMALSPLTALGYVNGTNVEGQWSSSRVEYGIGDPYVMKYNGMFYLYCSTYDPEIGVKVWSSEDMANWNYEGFCTDTTDGVMKGAYAPEVTYWNGTFYMYTAAPGGEQHRVLTSKSPTGPFVRQNDVFSFADDLIDGSVYIDDDEDATKYFLHSGFNSIMYGFLNDNMLTGTGNYALSAATVIGHWTEGPSIFKRLGKYYMTYCGNHVLADNYMIEYVAGDSVTGMKEPKENLLLINTEEGVTGLGHNSTVIGPDLDSRYIVYHNLDSNALAVERRLNIDRMVFNGEKLEVQGPTWWEMDNPSLPEFYDRMENENNWNTITGTSDIKDERLVLTGTSLALSKEATPDDYTAEFNLAIGEYTDGSRAGAVVSYKDAQNYAFAYIEPQTNTVHFDVTVNGQTTGYSANLPAEYRYSADSLNKLTVKKQGSRFDVFVDDRMLITAEVALGAGTIGLKTEGCTANYGYTAFSSAVYGNQDKDTVKPTGSAMDAVHANSTSRDFELGTITESGAGLESYYAKGVTKGDSLTYKINPQATSYYSAEILANAQAGTKVSLSVDGKEVTKDVDLVSSGSFYTNVVRNVAIDENAKEITLTVTEGTMDLYSVKLDKGEDIFEVTETQENMDYEWLNGTWAENGDTISATDSGLWSTATYGSENWGDYEYEGDISLLWGSDAGLFLRTNYATDASDQTNGIGGCDSPDYQYGYYVYINTSGIALGKQMFDWKMLASKTVALYPYVSYHIKARAEGPNIKVWLNDDLVIDYTDTDCPIMSGKVGLRTFMAAAEYRNLTLTHLNAAEPLGEPVTLAKDAMPINKNTFKVYSSALGKGYELEDGGIYFNNGAGRSIKGYMLDSAALDSTVSCELQLPGTGGFNAGLLVRCRPTGFGEDANAMDGVGVHLVKGANGSVDVNAYLCINGSQGNLKTVNIPNYFTDKQGRTAQLTVITEGNQLTAYLDGEECMSVDISSMSNSARTAVGFRGYQTKGVTLTNFTYKEGTHIPEIPEEPVELPFEDIAEDDWYYDVVYYNYVEGYMTGKSQTIFAPDDTLTRAELTSILYRTNGEPDVTYEAAFKDVAEDAWYADPVIWAYKNKVVSGYAEGDFKPDNAITREQLAVIMHNYATAKGYITTQSVELSAYDDAAQVSDWAKPAVQWAVATGVISGKDGVRLDPQGNATRAECAAIIQRFMENIVSE